MVLRIWTPISEGILTADSTLQLDNAFPEPPLITALRSFAILVTAYTVEQRVVQRIHSFCTKAQLEPLTTEKSFRSELPNCVLLLTRR